MKMRQIRRRVVRSSVLLGGVVLSLGWLTGAVHAQITVAPFYSGSYSFLSLGVAPGVPTAYGGITAKAGDTNTLLLGGAANSPVGVIRNVPITRDGSNHINGYNGSSTPFATAPNIDGGLAYGPNGVLFATTYSNNSLHQYKPGSATPDKTISLTPFGITSSTGTLQFVPTGVPGEGRFKIASYSSGGIYDVSLTPDGTGTFDLSSATLTTTPGGGPEGMVYVSAGNPLFPSSAMLISEYGMGRISAYDVDATGNPIVATRRDFVTGLNGVEGAAIDPLTGDFIFSTFSGNTQVVVVRGFAAPSGPVSSAAPEPAALGLLVATMLPVATLRLRRRRYI